jgi:hypothetical protein
VDLLILKDSIILPNAEAFHAIMGSSDEGSRISREGETSLDLSKITNYHSPGYGESERRRRCCH